MWFYASLWLRPFQNVSSQKATAQYWKREAWIKSKDEVHKKRKKKKKKERKKKEERRWLHGNQSLLWKSRQVLDVYNDVSKEWKVNIWVIHEDKESVKQRLWDKLISLADVFRTLDCDKSRSQRANLGQQLYSSGRRNASEREWRK